MTDSDKADFARLIHELCLHKLSVADLLPIVDDILVAGWTVAPPAKPEAPVEQ